MRLSLPGALGQESLGAPSLSAGDHGFPGSSGPRGDPGFKGDKGDVGLPGKPGSMDKVDMGSMKGEKGDQGEKGNVEEVHLRSGQGVRRATRFFPPDDRPTCVSTTCFK